MKYIQSYLRVLIILMIIQILATLACANELQIKQLIELAKPYNLDKTIRTLIKLETDDGKYLINLQSGDCGITQINIKTYMKRHGIKDTSFNRNKACMDLISSPELSVANSIEELLYWQKQHCKSGTIYCTEREYELVIKSYNTGWNYKSKQGDDYWKKFKQTYQLLYK